MRSCKRGFRGSVDRGAHRPAIESRKNPILGADAVHLAEGKGHLGHLLLSYMKYYNEARTHLSLEKDAPVSRAVERAGQILCRPILGGLHHQYVRI
jgi:hypothetical protein